MTVGYQGRYFEARNKPKGGAFEGDGFLSYLSFAVGDSTVIPAVDEAVRGMKTGGIRRIIVPAELGCLLPPSNPAPRLSRRNGLTIVSSPRRSKGWLQDGWTEAEYFLGRARPGLRAELKGRSDGQDASVRSQARQRLAAKVEYRGYAPVGIHSYYLGGSVHSGPYSRVAEGRGEVCSI